MKNIRHYGDDIKINIENYPLDIWVLIFKEVYNDFKLVDYYDVAHFNNNNKDIKIPFIITDNQKQVYDINHLIETLKVCKFFNGIIINNLNEIWYKIFRHDLLYKFNLRDINETETFKLEKINSLKFQSIIIQNNILRNNFMQLSKNHSYVLSENLNFGIGETYYNYVRFDMRLCSKSMKYFPLTRKLMNRYNKNYSKIIDISKIMTKILKGYSIFYNK